MGLLNRIKLAFTPARRYLICVPVNGLVYQYRDERDRLFEDLQTGGWGKCKKFMWNAIEIKTKTPYDKLYKFCNILYVEKEVEERALIVRMGMFDKTYKVYNKIGEDEKDKFPWLKKLYEKKKR